MATVQNLFPPPVVNAAGINLGTGGSSSQSFTNFSAGGEQALAALIQQLLNGGTTEQKENRSQRNQEIGSVRNIRNNYSKDAAMNDANLVIQQQQRKALEELLPTLVRSAEGAGTSKNAMRALMVQQAANQAAESAAALGLKASVDYGNISANLSGVLENLTKSDNPVTNALLSAINLSKGQQSSSQSVNSGGNANRTPTYGGTSRSVWDGFEGPSIDRRIPAMIASVGEDGFAADSRANQSTAGFYDSLTF